MKVMDISDLKKEAKIFCEFMKKENHSSLIGVTDGKAVGTYVEHRFQDYISSKYEIEIGSSAKGIDLPGAEIEQVLFSHRVVVRLKMHVRRYLD